MCRIRNLFRLSDGWYTGQDVSELLVIPIDSVYDMLGDLVDAAGYLERGSVERPTLRVAYRRLDK
jgi:hypothetical protein